MLTSSREAGDSRQISILVIQGTSGVYAPPDNRVVNRIDSLHGLFVKGQEKVGFFREALAPSKSESYAGRHVTSKVERETLRKLRP